MNDQPPVLALGLGNLLLGDDAVGLRLLEMLQAESADPRVEFVDGGTQGISLTGYLANRRGVLVLDAIGLGAAPGTVHVLRRDDVTNMRARRASNAHEGNGLGLLETARLLGDWPDEVAVVGIEPACVRTGIGLSPEVETGLQDALSEAREILRDYIGEEPYVSGRARQDR